MANDKPIHGAPVALPSTTQNPEVATDFNIVAVPRVFFDFRKWGGEIVEIEPTPRILDRLVRAMGAGNASALPPSDHPRPNALPKLIGPAGNGRDDAKDK